MQEKDVFIFYNIYIKPIYSEIEARNNTLPVELLFEIHSAFDHLKRWHTDEAKETLCCEKALSHLKRGVLDAFKLKLKYFNDDYNKTFTNSFDIGYIDNGDFQKKLLAKEAGQSQFWWGFLASFVASVLLTLVAWLYEIIQIRILW